MLQSAEYGEIKQDYGRISRTHFSGSYFYPDQMRFANSDALFATGDLLSRLAANTRASARFSVSLPTRLGRSCKPVYCASEPALEQECTPGQA